MKKTSTIASISCIAIGFALMNSSCSNSADKLPTLITKANFDTTVKPQQDFYKYVNGSWLKNNPIPADQSSWGSFDILYYSVLDQLKALLQDASSQKAQQGTLEQKLGDYYSVAMDSVNATKLGIHPLDEELAKIDAIKDMHSFWSETARLMKMGPDVMFSYDVEPDQKISTKEALTFGQGGMSLPNKHYYVDTTKSMATIRAKYLDFVKNIFMQMHESGEQAANDAQRVMKIETSLANGAMTPIEERDVHATYNKMTYAKFIATAPSVEWKTCFDSVGLSNIDTVIVNMPNFFPNLEAVIKATPIDDWKVYLKYHLVSHFASKLGDTLTMISFNFWNKTFGGADHIQPLWKRVVGNTSGALGELLGQLYVKKYFSPEAKQKVYDIVQHLIAAYKERINTLDWMDPVTKKAAIDKLDKVTLKLCYPDKWRDYTKLDLKRDAWVLNAIRVNEFEVAYDISKYGKPVDKTEWGMSPQTVNAYYNPTNNEIVFPAAILQMPFFDPNRDIAMNYGAIGAVIGHEMTHGFDDQGSQYDASGNMVKWWTTKDSVNYFKHLGVLIRQFDNYVIDSVHVQGALTIGENTADLGGITIAYYALQNEMKEHPEEVKDGFTPEQRFFISFAQVWRSNDRPESVKSQVQNDPHSPGQFRADGPPSDFKEFYTAFNVKPGDGMYRPDSLRAVIW
ncbi:MAG TPA: M13 family metallopeptidase [Bacteroidia bacterium]|jgi:putative endopeptidase|nr:M13 family metallopeptidase [Bacteroidia bacterium]